MAAAKSPFDKRSKKLELAARRSFNRLFRSQRMPTVIDDLQGALKLSETPSILFLRQDRIGDVLITAPIIRAVREKYPRAHIGVVLSRNNIAVERTLRQFVDVVHVYQKTAMSLIRIISEIRLKKYEVVIDLLDNTSTTSSILVAASGATYSLGIDKENRGVYTHVVPLLDRSTVHISNRVQQLLRGVGVEPSTVDMRPMYPITEQESSEAKVRLFTNEIPKHAVGIVYSGSSPRRTFPEQKVQSLVEQLHNRFPMVSFYIFGAPHHHEEVERIGRTSGAHAVAPSTSFHEYACALHQMTAIVSPDTSSVHLAAAWNTPICVLFNQPNVDLMPWYPYATHVEAVINRGEDLNDVTVDAVVTAAEHLFAYCKIPKGSNGIS